MLGGTLGGFVGLSEADGLAWADGDGVGEAWAISELDRLADAGGRGGKVPVANNTIAIAPATASPATARGSQLGRRAD